MRVPLAESDVLRRVEELERSNRDLNEFAVVASHDLQAPLHVVQGYLDLLGAALAKGDPVLRTYVHEATEAARRMETMIQDLLAYARLGTQAARFAPCDPEGPLRDALANLRLAAVETGAHVSTGPLPHVVADPAQLALVFQNLVSNGMKFHGDAPPEVRVSAQRDGRHVVFRVQDNGVGMDERQLARLFMPFQRLHGDRFQGNGLGLASAKRIVERHGGRIWAESSPGRGSTFLFTLPAAGE